jgi:hypothetical protein
MRSSARRSPELWAQSTDGFRHLVRKPFDQSCCRLLSAAVSNLQALGRGAHRCPDIAMRKTLPHLPALSEETDFSRSIDTPNEMEAPGRDRQLFKKRRELLLGQSLPSYGSLCRRGDRHWQSSRAGTAEKRLPGRAGRASSGPAGAGRNRPRERRGNRVRSCNRAVARRARRACSNARPAEHRGGSTDVSFRWHPTPPVRMLAWPDTLSWP